MRRCPVCAVAGSPHYMTVTDRLFQTPGVWQLMRCRTADCGTLWLDPTPSPEDLAHAYRGYYTGEISQQRDTTALTFHLQRFDRVLRRSYLRRFYGYPFDGPTWLWVLSLVMPWRWRYYAPSVMRLPYRAGGRLLDVGAGNGAFMAAMRDLRWDVEGVEVDDRARAAAQLVHGVILRAGTIEQQQFADQSFDAVVLRHVVEHVTDPLGVLRECHRVLKVGGCLAIVTPNAQSLGARLFGVHWRGLEPPRHLQVFTLASLERAVRAAGFDRIAARSTSQDPYLLIASYALARNKPFERGVPKLTRLERLFLETMLMLECAWLLLRPEAGAEAVLIGHRTTP